jgi:hypothetical protein
MKWSGNKNAWDIQCTEITFVEYVISRCHFAWGRENKSITHYSAGENILFFISLKYRIIPNKWETNIHNPSWAFA